ncbi:MAG: tRNA (N6-threonylcarbamoyladenosine(37)-N6)-methyltransferase TrmO [Deltaproteobacteria bacterium]|nr:tRNA (N6-threonylcarbamoyladenosine(37)-N6)-methyltransferase TrmO [Deltaproteobacteria bacterium]
MTQIILQPIGLIHSPFQEPQGTPIQPLAARDVAGVVEIFPEFVPGLRDLEGFSRLILIYHFHLAKAFTLQVKPFLDKEDRGVFATRAPARPCPIGLSVVRLDKIEGNRLLVLDVDVVNNTPLLDIKPYVPQFDSFPEEKIGWMTDKIGKLPDAKDDGRFVK